MPILCQPFRRIDNPHDLSALSNPCVRVDRGGSRWCVIPATGAAPWFQGVRQGGQTVFADTVGIGGADTGFEFVQAFAQRAQVSLDIDAITGCQHVSDAASK
jgi:hypothetical protein